MNYQLNPMPEPVKEDWDKYDLESCVTEVRNLRHFVGSLFMQVKEWTGRMNDLQQTSEQSIALKGNDESKYIALSNKTAEHDNRLQQLEGMMNDILDALKEETTDDIN